MASKTIPELQPISSPNIATTYLAVDDGTQTFKLALSQILRYPRAYRPAMTYIPGSASTMNTFEHVVDVYLLKDEDGQEWWFAEINVQFSISSTIQSGFELAFAGLEFENFIPQIGKLGVRIGVGVTDDYITSLYTKPGTNRLVAKHENQLQTGYSIHGRFMLSGKPDFVVESMLVVEEGEGTFSGEVPRALIEEATPNFVLINDALGNVSEEAQLAPVRGGLGVDASAANGVPKFTGGVATFLTTIPPSMLDDGINANKIGGGTVSNASFAYISTLSANAQTQINNINTALGNKADSTAVSAALADKLNKTNGVATGLNVDDYFDIDEETAPTNPGSGKVRIYALSGGRIKKKNSAGVESDLGGGLVGLEQTATPVSPAVNGTMYEYGNISGVKSLVLPGGTTAFAIGVMGNGTLTNYLDVTLTSGTMDEGTANDGYRFRSPGFNVVFYRAEGSSEIKSAKSIATLIVPGSQPGYTGATPISAGNIGEPASVTLRAGTGGKAFTTRSSSPITGSGVNLFGGIPLKKGVYWVGFTTSYSHTYGSVIEVTFQLHIGGVGVMNTQRQNPASGVYWSFAIGGCLIQIDVDDTVLDVRSGVNVTHSTSNNAHEMSIVRIA